MSIFLNGQKALNVRLCIPWRGVWIADVTLDLLDSKLAQKSGPAVLLINDNLPMKCFIDPTAAGTFGPYASVRVVGGQANGWGKTVSRQHFTNPGGGLVSTAVIAATATEVGEVALDPTPTLYGAHFARMAGPASAVFQDRDWYVDPLTGFTNVSSWLPSVQPTDLIISAYDITQQRLSIHTDLVLLPGTVVVDERFNGTTLTVRDVEQTFDENGSRAEAWCSDASISRLQEAFANAVRQFAGTMYLKHYKYRFVVAVGANKLALQGITPGAPDLNPIDQWSGMSGLTGKLAPSTEIIVGFAGPTEPYIVSYSPLATPLEVDVGGPAGLPLVTAPWAVSLVTALTVFATAAGLSVTDPVLSAAAAALNIALKVLPPPATLIAKGV